MGIFTKACPQCGTRVLRGVRDHCSTCGATVHGLWKTCGGCGEFNSGDALHCTSCRHAFMEGQGVAQVLRRTYRDDGRPVELARAFSLEPGDLSQGVLVENGMQVFFVDNSLVRLTMPAGNWSAGQLGVADQLANIRTAVLVEAGDIAIDFGFSGLLTKDRQELRVEFRLVFRLEAVESFLTNLLKGQQEFTYVQMRKQLLPELKNAVADFVASCSADEIALGGVPLKRRMEKAIGEIMAPSLQRFGLQLIQLRATAFEGPWIDAEAELGQAALAEKRAVVWEQLQKVLDTRKLKEITSATDLEAAIRDIEMKSAKKSVLREEELESLKRSLMENTEDHTEQRRRLKEMAEMNHGLEMDSIEALARGELGHKVAVQEVETARVRDTYERDKALANADVQTEIDQKELELAKRANAVRLDAEREEMGIALERQRAGQDHELERIRNLKDLSPEQILAIQSMHSGDSAAALQAMAQANASAQHNVQDLQGQMLDRMMRVVENQGRPPAPAHPSPAFVPTVLCPACRSEVAASAKGCSRCGQAFAS